MNNTIDLEALETRAYASRWDDGLLDLFVGLSVLLIGLAWLTPGWEGLGGVAPALLIPFWPLARKWVTEPRSGYVEFGQARQQKERRSLKVLAALGLGAFLLGVAMYVIVSREGMMGEDWVAIVVPALPGVLLGIGGVVAAFMFSLDRLLGYSAVVVGLALVFTYAGAEPGIYLALSGALITVAGVFMIARFVRRFPRNAGTRS